MKRVASLPCLRSQTAVPLQTAGDSCAVVRKSGTKDWAIILYDLVKMRISFLAMLSAAFGYILATGRASTEMLVPVTSVFILACGASTINQYQENEFDALMERTKGRPIPSGRVAPLLVLRVGLLLLLMGSFTLLLNGDVTVLVLGLFAVFWYNGIYTYLKRKSAFAAVPGALVGAIPAVMGWASGRGSLSLDPPIVATSLFFFMWQMPHFWLLLLGFDKEYQKAGFPSLVTRFDASSLRRIIFVWICATAVSSILIPLVSLMESYLVFGGLFAGGAWLIRQAIGLLGDSRGAFSPNSIFNSINLYALWVMFLLVAEQLAHHCH